jgi:hypothetical protein
MFVSSIFYFVLSRQNIQRLVHGKFTKNLLAAQRGRLKGIARSQSQQCGVDLPFTFKHCKYLMNCLN